MRLRRKPCKKCLVYEKKLDDASRYHDIWAGIELTNGSVNWLFFTFIFPLFFKGICDVISIKYEVFTIRESLPLVWVLLIFFCGREGGIGTHKLQPKPHRDHGQWASWATVEENNSWHLHFFLVFEDVRGWFGRWKGVILGRGLLQYPHFPQAGLGNQEISITAPRG